MADEECQADVRGLRRAARVHDDDEDELGCEEHLEEETPCNGHPRAQAVDDGQGTGEKCVGDASGGDGGNALGDDGGDGALPFDGAED